LCLLLEREKIINYVCSEASKPVSVNEIMVFLGASSDKREELAQLLDSLEEEGKIVRTRKNRYGSSRRMNLIVGRLQAHSKGYGFVIAEGEDDIYIPADQINGAMHKDLVLVRLARNLQGRKLREGEIVRVLKRVNQQIVGTYSGSARYGFVVPDDRRLYQDIFIPTTARGKACTGDVVVVDITQWPQDRRNPEGKVVEVLGKKGDTGVDILAIMRKYGLEASFPNQVLAEADRIPCEVVAGDIEGRVDLRHLPIVTIDNEDAKDLDDAISIEKLENGSFRLGVHIADVAHYVREGSELEKEAQKRGCSVYLVDRVIPMLPPRLSNGICSLNRGEDRLALSVFIELNEKGAVVSHKLMETVINVGEKLTYDIVNELIVEKKEETIQRYSGWLNTLEQMGALCKLLQKRRVERGSIDFQFKEKEVKLDETGHPLAVQYRQRGFADEIIEEFMLITNSVVASQIYFLNLPSVYRVHEQPDEEAIVPLRDFLHNLGYTLRGGKRIRPQELQKILTKARNTPEERAINEIVLRSLKRARYSPLCLGHFGLAVKFYTHFTAPIRRYPDILVHRVIKRIHKGEVEVSQFQGFADKLPALAVHSSEREQIAEEAERETIDLKVVEYMLDKIGEVYEGIISGVVSFGFFVELPNSVEGLVHVSSMTDDYYHYLEQQLALRGERTKKIFRIGDPVMVQVTKVNPVERTIDFEIIKGGRDR
jgi:ribonuclease R